MTEAILRIRNLSVEFGPATAPIKAVDHIDLEIPAKGCLGLVGESGSGKSMASLAILRLVPSPGGRISSGSIEFGGRDLLKLPASQMPAIRGSDIAMIFQEPMSSLNPVMTIGDQIGEVIKLHEHTNSSARRARVLDALAAVGIPDPAERISSYPNQFSGGMRQRVMIAMALVCNPKLLIADEPTTALDVTVQAQVLDLIQKLRQSHDTAVLLISHDLGVVAETADTVAVMYSGKVVETGSVSEIFDHAAHPYTRGLLKSIPRLDDDQDRLYQIDGSVPSPSHRPKGCAFVTRCPLRQPLCAEQAPPMFNYAGTQKAACWVTSGAIEQ